MHCSMQHDVQSQVYKDTQMWIGLSSISDMTIYLAILCFSFGSAVVTWSSKKQPTVALSSTEAECRGACSGSM